MTKQNESAKQSEQTPLNSAKLGDMVVRLAPTPEMTKLAKEIPRRKEVLRNTVVESRGGARLLQPDPESIAAIQQATSGKVLHVPSSGAEAFAASDLARVQSWDFAKYVMEPVIADATSRFEGKLLAMRGIATSINGDFDGFGDEDHPLLDLSRTVNNGIEKPGDAFNVAVLNPEEPISVHRVTQYAENVSLHRMLEDNADKAAAMFPAVLVYDAAGLQKESGYWAVSFREGVEPSDVLLGAYILDCPEK